MDPEWGVKAPDWVGVYIGGEVGRSGGWEVSVYVGGRVGRSGGWKTEGIVVCMRKNNVPKVMAMGAPHYMVVGMGRVGV